MTSTLDRFGPGEGEAQNFHPDFPKPDSTRPGAVSKVVEPDPTADIHDTPDGPDGIRRVRAKTNVTDLRDLRALS